MCIRDRHTALRAGVGDVITVDGVDVVPEVQAVSYTHLDVYKRQGICCVLQWKRAEHELNVG